VSAVAAFALTEPDAGTDAAALALHAEPTDGGWRLHGEKTVDLQRTGRGRVHGLRPDDPRMRGARRHRLLVPGDSGRP
jgi:hypothetical protein